MFCRSWLGGMLGVLAAIGCVSRVAVAAPDPTAGPSRPNDPAYLDGWRMAGANPQRTSWVPEEVPGQLQLEWYKPFEPFISQKVQVIAADGLLFISTARGLYALEASTGEVKWVYPTELPLGHSPTVVGGVAYVGGFDRCVHALDAARGKRIWVSEPAGAGFNTNPVVADGRVYAGNRDGTLYAFDAATGKKAWQFTTELHQPILFSCAYKDAVLYFACNDMHAYAVDARTGKELWKSDKLPGAGFHSWWPVIYGDRVIFTGSSNYRGHGRPSTVGGIFFLEDQALFGGNEKQSGWGGALAPNADVPWKSDPEHPTLDFSKKSAEGNGPVSKYYEAMPWRRTYLMLDCSTGKEITYDFDGDGKREYAPLAYVGTHSGNRYPPIVGGDGLLYQSAGGVKGQPWISRGGIVRWKLDSPFVGVMSIEAHDETQAIAGGGNLIQYYHSEYYDGTQGSIDINTRRMQAFYWYIDKIAPDIMDWPRRYANYVHGAGGENPPIPYRGRVYQVRWNHVICFSPQGGKRKLAVAAAPKAPPAPAAPAPAPAVLKTRLLAEVEKMLQAGHLRTGWMNRGLCANFLEQVTTDNFDDYFSLPEQTIEVFTRALPFLPAEMQSRLTAYLKTEFEAFPPDKVAHIGWQGAAREAADLPSEMADIINRHGPSTQASGRVRDLYSFPPHANYALYKYAQLVRDTNQLLSRLRPIGKIPADDVLMRYPWAHNAFISGLAGVVALSEKAGRPNADAKATLERLLKLRADTFSKDRPAPKPKEGNARLTFEEDQAMKRTIAEFLPQTIARNFMFLTPELASYLNQHAIGKVREACSEYNQIHPHWFVSKAEEGFGENIFNPLFDYHTLFQAKAMILREPYEELVKYLDVPAFWRGDLYYIDNLCACLEAAGR